MAKTSITKTGRTNRHASRAARSGRAGRVSGRTTGRSSLGGPFPGQRGPLQPPAGTGPQPGPLQDESITTWTLTPYEPTATDSATDSDPIPQTNTLIGIHPELPLLECPDCDSQVSYIPRMRNCAYTCVECGTKWIFSNGILSHKPIVPQAGVDKGKVITVYHVATDTFQEVTVKRTSENVSTCIGCNSEDLAFSLRVSRFSHVGSREIQSKTYPYETKKVYYPVYLKGRYCELCCATLRADTKVINEGKLDERTIGIWRDAEDREVNILMETERNTTIDTQTIKGMNREIKDNRPEMDRSNYRLMRIPGLDEPIVLAYGELKEKADPRAYNALFGKRQVNRYGRHVIEPAFNDREK